MKRIPTRFHAAWGFSLVALGLLACAGCDQTEITKTPVPVRVVKVARVDIGNSVRYSANITPISQVDLSFQSNGYIKSIKMVRGADGKIRKLDEGDWVVKGTVLAVVDQQDYIEKLQQANAQLDRAKAEMDRARLAFARTSALYSSQSATKPDLDRDRAQYESTQASVASAKAEIAQAQIALDYCSLQAPFDGWIVKRDVDLGSLVGPTTHGFTLISTHDVKAVFGVPDTAIQRVRLGSVQEITTDASSDSFQGKVTSISPAADPKSRVYSVEVTVPNANNRLKSGMIATIALPGEELRHAVIAVPLESVIRDPRRSNGFAVVIAPGTDAIATAEVRPVELGDPYGNVVAITQGINLGERVLTRGSTLVQNGDQVRIIP